MQLHTTPAERPAPWLGKERMIAHELPPQAEALVLPPPLSIHIHGLPIVLQAAGDVP
jgi:hypothetical protein